MRHIQRIPLRYFDNTPIGQVVSRIANDTEAVRDLFMSFMATFVVSMVQLIGHFRRLVHIGLASGAVLLGAAAAFCVHYVRSFEIFENLHHHHARPAQRYECDD